MLLSNNVEAIAELIGQLDETEARAVESMARLASAEIEALDNKESNDNNDKVDNKQEYTNALLDSSSGPKILVDAQGTITWSTATEACTLDTSADYGRSILMHKECTKKPVPSHLWFSPQVEWNRLLKEVTSDASLPLTPEEVQVYITMIRNHCASLKDIPSVSHARAHLHPAVIAAALQHNPLNATHIWDENFTNEIAYDLVSINGSLLRFVPVAYKTLTVLTKAAHTAPDLVLDELAEAYMDERYSFTDVYDIVKVCVGQDGRLITRLKTSLPWSGLIGPVSFLSMEIFKLAVTNYPLDAYLAINGRHRDMRTLETALFVLGNVDKLNLEQTKSLCDAVVLQWKNRGSKGVMMEVVKLSGAHLKFACNKLLDDYELCYEAVSKDGTAIEYVSERLKKNTSLLLLSCGTEPHANKSMMPSIVEGAKSKVELIEKCMAAEDAHVDELEWKRTALKRALERMDEGVEQSKKRKLSHVSTLQSIGKAAASAARNNPAVVQCMDEVAGCIYRPDGVVHGLDKKEFDESLAASLDGRVEGGEGVEGVEGVEDV